MASHSVFSVLNDTPHQRHSHNKLQLFMTEKPTGTVNIEHQYGHEYTLFLPIILYGQY